MSATIILLNYRFSTDKSNNENMYRSRALKKKSTQISK